MKILNDAAARRVTTSFGCQALEPLFDCETISNPVTILPTGVVKTIIGSLSRNTARNNASQTPCVGGEKTAATGTIISFRQKQRHHQPRNMVCVGSIVRAPLLPNHSKVRRRGVVATIEEEHGEELVTILWEDDAPHRRLTQAATATAPGDRRAGGTFLVAPAILVNASGNKTAENDEEDELEITMPLKDVAPLLDFEIAGDENDATQTSSSDIAGLVSLWKGRGDALLRLGDASAAVPYYEEALRLSSGPISVGCTILIKDKKGFVKLADVDCVNNSDDDAAAADEKSTVDVCLTDSGDEMTVKKGDVLLRIMESRDGQQEARIQERILLNLARCLMQLADATTAVASHSLRRRPEYLKGAVRATTYAMSVADYHDHNSSGNGDTTTRKTALLLRCRAHLSMSKFPHANVDVRKLLKLDSQHKEGKRLERQIEREQLQRQKTDKKLVREMCRWVDTVTKEEPSVSANASNDKVSNDGAAARTTAGFLDEDEHQQHTPPHAAGIFSSLPWILSIFFVAGLAAFLARCRRIIVDEEEY